ncbi:enoyl-CoA hydratase/isomerase family protein [Corynebacterium aquilae]|uniref:3-hydroxyisobutyryl-CoA hydrolase n=1 Tax=Corynebacterium aquilae DSM 44791 TaxID=1431546 RepID=A0A1L7CES9_9CORY|nr:enoyl-CoA hydratase/isomerase family protein [Corynebacterium aquilae]APT84372.1 3-hydroxyisobutyryl-CoA hydrolase [Corynebacterium aquilae DSM 44791]
MNASHTSAQTTGDQFVNVSVRNTTGCIELNRPKALNSLNHDMINTIAEAIEGWRDDDSVHRVVIFSSTERAFCAGGDVRSVRDAGVEGDFAAGDQLFVDEYVMNNDLGQFPKPIVSVINGVAMGGGLGVSCHGSHRVITERAFAAMPEMAIGFIPDVGMTYMMEHMVGTRGKPSRALAVFLGVTGWRLSPADMIWSGMATHHIDSANTEEFIQVTIEESLDEALERFATEPAEQSKLAGLIDDIEATFNKETWAEIQQALEDHGNEEFKNLVYEHIEKSSPTSVVAAVELFAANLTATTLRHALDNELALGNYLRRGHDFPEGVRAVLIDKDRNPNFEPKNFEDVDVEAIRGVLKRDS